MTGFGWSFYGFFLFAVSWIAAYFAWAWWVSRERPRTGNQNSEPEGRDRARVQGSGIGDPSSQKPEA